MAYLRLEKQAGERVTELCDCPMPEGTTLHHLDGRDVLVFRGVSMRDADHIHDALAAAWPKGDDDGPLVIMAPDDTAVEHCRFRLVEEPVIADA
jgi:hypothetical protein